MVHHDDVGSTNKLDAARKALRHKIAAREQIERQLEEARATIQALKTQSAHERIAKDEGLRRAENQRQQIERQFDKERLARQQAEQERDVAIAGRQDAVGRLQEVMVAQEVQKPSGAAVSAKRGEVSGATTGRLVAGELEIVPATKSVDDAATGKGRQRGRPRAHPPEAQVLRRPDMDRCVDPNQRSRRNKRRKVPPVAGGSGS